jgi:(R,R)-butanediol dehydrogenase/meso-butanediol dehydrogenase/diacetyl reductase
LTDTMRAALWTGPEQIEYADVERPTPAANQVLIKVAYAGICGTDLTIYLGKHTRARAPLVMSHEFSGTVAEDPSGALPVGTPVVVNPLLMCGHCYACRNGLSHICSTLGLVGIDRDGGFAEYVAAPAHTVRPIPTSLSLQRAALVEPLAVAVHAVSVSDLRVGDTTAVLGAGPVGILVAQIARLAGALRVFVSEVSPKRLAIARELGFSVIDATRADPVDEILAATDGEGVPVVFESAGSQTTIFQAGRIARLGGQILQVGMPKTAVTIDMTPVMFREVRSKPIRVYREQDVQRAIAIAAGGRVDLDRPVTHILPIAELAKGLELAHAASDACKVLIAPAV